MPKTKTHSGSKKRFKLTSTGKIMRKGIGKRHNLGQDKKSTKQKRKLGYQVVLSPGDVPRIKKLLNC
ncbi:MAG: 50S ribosomal protein L35 [Bacteroidota bacterium]